MKADDGKLCNSILAVGIPVLRAVHVICPAPPPVFGAQEGGTRTDARQTTDVTGQRR